MLANEIATCSPVAMELLWTARDPSGFGALRDELEALPQLPVTARAWERAIEVWHELVRRGRHRQIKPADYVIAAVAELSAVGLCHYDGDFDAIALVTAQPVRAIAPIGSL